MFGHCDNLSCTSQRSEITVAEGQSTVSLTVSALQHIHTDEIFNLFWDRLQRKSRMLMLGSLYCQELGSAQEI